MPREDYDDRDRGRGRDRDDDRGGRDRDRGRDDDRGGRDRDRSRDDGRGGRNASSRAGGGARFEYKRRSPEEIRKRAEASGRNFDGIYKDTVKVWRPKSGENLIRILPPTWQPNDGHFGYEVFLHKFVGGVSGSYLCPEKMNTGDKCAVCEEMRAAKKEGADEEEVKKLSPKQAYVCYVLDRDDRDNPNTPQLTDFSWSQDKAINEQTSIKRTGETLYIDDPDHGYDLIVKKTGSGMTGTKYTFIVERDKSPLAKNVKTQDAILAEATDNPIPDMLVWPDYEKVKLNLSGATKPRDDDDDDRGRGRDRDDDRGRGRDRDDDRGGRGRDRADDTRGGREYDDGRDADRGRDRDADRGRGVDDDAPRSRARSRLDEDDDRGGRDRDDRGDRAGSREPDRDRGRDDDRGRDRDDDRPRGRGDDRDRDDDRGRDRDRGGDRGDDRPSARDARDDDRGSRGAREEVGGRGARDDRDRDDDRPRRR